ncbi:hypothetical protein [Rothia halotolerans]|uniref:hypothetical protein n=1 Tax=Rothia halotolerans TaxID=405770 RepID=UPI00101C52FC|nr:hypothetical protein [Rothia halotolerans]
MNVILVGLTLLVLAGTLIACVSLGSDRFAAAQHVSRDGIEVLPPARGPLEGPSWNGHEGAEAEGADDADAGPAGSAGAGHRDGGPADGGPANGAADGRGGA